MSYINIQDRDYPFALRYVRDLLMYRHLAWSLVGSDLRARFRRSRLGIIWAVIQPLTFSLIIAVVWGGLMGAEDYWSFAVYVFSGWILWEYFANVVNLSQDALLNAEGHLRQTRIPFIVFQTRLPLTGLVILSCGLLGLLIMLAALGDLPEPGLHLLLVPAFFGVFLIFSIPLAIIMSVLGTQFRDLKHISGILVQGLFFLSPVMFPREMLAKPELWFLKFINPMVPLIDMFRTPLIDSAYWDTTSVYTVAVWTLVLWIAAITISGFAGRRIVFAL